MRRILILPLFFLLAATAFAGGPQELRLLISAGNAAASPLYPLHLTLHFLNTAKQPLWLYYPVRDRGFVSSSALASQAEEAAPGTSSSGSTLEVSLTPANPAVSAPAAATVLLPIESPEPRLVRLEPGGEDDEQVLIHLAPAGAGKQSPVGGVYKLAVTYRAHYSNQDDIERLLGIDLWHAEAVSNALEISLQPGKGRGTVSGVITGSDAEPAPAMVVSLSDQDERTISEVLSGLAGQYSFEGLPWGFYWVTARRPNAAKSTAVFQHVVLSPASPSATADLMMLSSAPQEPKNFPHKPVLVEVVDKNGRPVEGVDARSVFSNPSGVEDLKARTGADGVAEFELIPGSNFLSLKQRGCPEEDRRMDVASGGGVAAFRFEISCAKN